MRSAQLRVLTNFGCAAGLLLLLNGRVTPTQFVDYRPSSDSIWNQASSAVSTAASSLGLMEGSTSRESDIATADALTAFQALSKSGFGDKVGGDSCVSLKPQLSLQLQHLDPRLAPSPALPVQHRWIERLPHHQMVCVWLVHADKTRSHVGYPPAASPSPTPSRPTMAWQPIRGSRWRGAYFLDEAQSAAACKLDACDADGGLACPTDGRVVGDRRNRYAAAAPPMVPLLGCGSEQWRRMDAILVTAFRPAGPGQLGPASRCSSSSAGRVSPTCSRTGSSGNACRTARVCRTGGVYGR